MNWLIAPSFVLAMLQAYLIALKLNGTLDCTWLIVATPIWAPVVLIFTTILWVFCFFLIYRARPGFLKPDIKRFCKEEEANVDNPGD